MIRTATPADAPRLAEMGVHFMRASHYSRVFTPDPDIAARLTALVLDRGVIFVAEDAGDLVGMLAALAGPWLGVGPVVATEIAWWVEPRYRGGMAAVRLLRAFEGWATEQGAAVAQMIAPEAKTMSIYERLDYQATEVAYMKRLH